MKPFGFSLADQALVVGGTFLVNVILARTQTKEEYGMFALSYSVFTFLAGLHGAAILEPYTVYGSGRHRARFSEYFCLMARSNAAVGLLMTTALLAACLVFRRFAPHLVSRALVGLGMTAGILLSGSFLRRVFYMQRRASLAAGTSFAFFLTVVAGLWVASRMQALNGFSAYILLALGWIVAGAIFARKLPFERSREAFLKLEPDYWREHFRYTRWVFASALAIQLSTQSYYWLVAGILSVKDVANLRAIYLLIAPVDQLFIALNYLVLPALAAHYAAKRMEKFMTLEWQIGLVTVGITALFALAVRLVGRPVMHVLYAGRFDNLAPLLYLLALLPLLMGIGNTINDALKAAELPKLVFYGYLASGAATFLVGVPLVIRYGLLGAVMGVLSSAAAYTCALVIGFLTAFRGYTRMVARVASE
ncbi:MAG: lipopolysaccharide biosynthesis protein [Candidatus Acidiferrales bacterium]